MATTEHLRHGAEAVTPEGFTSEQAELLGPVEASGDQNFEHALSFAVHDFFVACEFMGLDETLPSEPEVRRALLDATTQ